MELAYTPSPRPIFFALSFSSSLLTLSYIWHRWQLKHFEKKYPYVNAAIALVKENDVFQTELGLNPKLLPFKKGTIDVSGRFGRVQLKFQNNEREALIFIGTQFIESSIRKVAQIVEYEELNTYNHSGETIYSLFLKPHLIKLKIKQFVLSCFTSLGFIYQNRQLFLEDTSYWEISNISLVIRPYFGKWSRIKRLLLRMRYSQKKIAQLDRENTFILSIIGTPNEHPDMETIINPLEMNVRPESKLKLKWLCFTVCSLLLLYLRKRFRSGLERTQNCYEDELWKKIKELPPFIHHPSIKLTEMKGSISSTVATAIAHIHYTDKKNKEALQFVASRRGVTQPFQIHSWKLLKK